MNDKEYFDRRQSDHIALRKAYPKFKPDVVGQLQTVLDAARINTKQFITDAKDDKIIKNEVYEVLRSDREHVWSLNEFVTEQYVTIVQPLIDIIGGGNGGGKAVGKGEVSLVASAPGRWTFPSGKGDPALDGRPFVIKNATNADGKLQIPRENCNTVGCETYRKRANALLDARVPGTRSLIETIRCGERNPPPFLVPGVDDNGGVGLRRFNVLNEALKKLPRSLQEEFLREWIGNMFENCDPKVFDVSTCFAVNGSIDHASVGDCALQIMMKGTSDQNDPLLYFYDGKVYFNPRKADGLRYHSFHLRNNPEPVRIYVIPAFLGNLHGQNTGSGHDPQVASKPRRLIGQEQRLSA